MGWVIFLAGLIAWASCPAHIDMKTTGTSGAVHVAVMWFAWALVVIAMIAGLVIVEVRP